MINKKAFKKGLKVLFQRKIVLVAFLGIVFLILVAIFAPFLTPYEPNATSFRESLAQPSAEHWLGADFGGRDVLTRIIYGTRVALLTGVLSVLISAVIGSIIGVMCAYYGGVFDNVVMRVIDAFRAIPQTLLAMALIAVFDSGILNIALILGFTTIPDYIRMMRSSALVVKNSDYMLAARLKGCSPMRQMMKHMIPNCLSPIIVMATMQVGATIIVESGLSFLGIGISIPTASWGSLLSEAKTHLLNNPVYAISPGVAIAILVICMNTFGDGVRDALDPRLRGDV